MTTSVYLHIPFCEHICTYCDFCKMFYNEELVNKYLDALKGEIEEKYQGEIIKTIYIGGGTPSSLSMNNLKKLLEIVKIFKLQEQYEFTFEVNPENITLEKLLLLKKNRVNRISMGIESTSDKLLKYLGRHHNFEMVQEKIKLIKQASFDNINVDLIYALPIETIDDLQNDLQNIVKLDVNHVSTYSLEIHRNTILGIRNEQNINEDIDSDMYQVIGAFLKKNGYKHYEVSNFSKGGYESKHNLVYWHNKEYYGFGLGASSYVNSIRYDNTRSIHEYLNHHYKLTEEKLTPKDKISYALILGFRLIGGINKKEFKKEYGVELIDQYNIKDLIKLGYLIDDGFNVKVSYDKIYVENSILENFV